MTKTIFSRTGRRVLMPALCSLLLSLSALAQDTSDHQYTSESIQTGSRVYVQQCALCHGPQGDSIDGVNLRQGQFRTATSDEDLARIVSGGAAGGRMPAFNLRPEELNGVIAYIRAGFGPDGVAIRIGDPARGKAIYDGKGLPKPEGEERAAVVVPPDADDEPPRLRVALCRGEMGEVPEDGAEDVRPALATHGNLCGKTHPGPYPSVRIWTMCG